jgi:hypothetical protein
MVKFRLRRHGFFNFIKDRFLNCRNIDGEKMRLSNLRFVNRIFIVIQVFLERKIVNFLLYQVSKLSSLSFFITLKRVKRKESTTFSTDPCSCCKWFLSEVPRQIVQLVCYQVLVAYIFIIGKTLVDSFLTIIITCWKLLFGQLCFGILERRLIFLSKWEVSFYVRNFDLLLRVLVDDSLQAVLLFSLFLGDFRLSLVFRSF